MDLTVIETVSPEVIQDEITNISDAVHNIAETLSSKAIGHRPRPFSDAVGGGHACPGAV